MPLWRAIGYRLMLAALTIAVGGFVSATLVRYAPGFGSDERQLDARLSASSRAAIHQEIAGEERVTSYYAAALGGMLRGDLGKSRSLQRPVRELLIERGAVTLRVVGAGLTTAWAATLSLICVTWLLRSAALRTICAASSGLLLCLPAGALAILLILLNGPGYVALALVVFPRLHRYLSNLVQSTAGMPHILTARAKGVSGLNILIWHIGPVIRGEVLALAGVSIGVALSAAIPVEALCGIAGIGQLAWQSALARDLPVLLNVSLLVIACTVLANSGADLLTKERRRPS